MQIVDEVDVFAKSSQKVCHTIVEVSYNINSKRWKPLTLAHPTVGKSLKSDTLGPTWRGLKSRDGPEIRIFAHQMLAQDSSLWSIP